jgi:hypothetical protein
MSARSSEIRHRVTTSRKRRRRSRRRKKKLAPLPQRLSPNRPQDTHCVSLLPEMPGFHDDRWMQDTHDSPSKRKPSKQMH